MDFLPKDENVFVLKGFEDDVAAALFSRYSRCDGDLRQVYAKEFEGCEGEKANSFFDRVLGEYGDDSVAQLGGAHIGLEGVSVRLCQLIANSRIGVALLQKSTRYMNFAKPANGEDISDLFVVPESVKNSNIYGDYLAVMSGLLEAYNLCHQQILDRETQKVMQEKGSILPPEKRAISSAVFDAVRNLLPTGIKTSIGIYANAAAYEHLLYRLRSCGYGEARETADKMEAALNLKIAPLIRRVSTDKGASMIGYLQKLELKQREISQDNLISWYRQRINRTGISCELVDYDENNLNRVIVGILYPYSNTEYKYLVEYILGASSSEKEEVISKYIGDRLHRRQKIGKAFELANYTFEIQTSVGAWQDLHRHRLQSELLPPLTIDLGYQVPELVVENGCEQVYRQAMDSVKPLYESMLREGIWTEAEYCIPMGYQTRWLSSMNLRQASFVAELRSVPQGHIDYRKIAWRLADSIVKQDPWSEKCFKFVDRQQTKLGRLFSEQKLEEKRSAG